MCRSEEGGVRGGALGGVDALDPTAALAFKPRAGAQTSLGGHKDLDTQNLK